MTFEDDLLALEARVLRAAAGDFLAAVDELRQMLAASSPGIQRKLLQLAIPDIETAARAGIVEAHQLGAEWAIGSAEILPGIAANEISDARARTAVTPRHLEDPVDGLNTRVADAKTRALTLLSAGSPIEEALAPVFGSATSTKATIETQINAASNNASQTVGEAVRSPMVWEAERDACVYCLALAGEVVERAGDLFPKADLYDDGKTGQQTLSQPPLHPHCRCRLAVLGDQSYADALKREAQRSILRGFSLKTESNAVRVRAAKRLLDRDPVAPKSVKDYARKAVKAGRFPRGRDVPEGAPTLIVR
jgi:hypothetical protein